MKVLRGVLERTYAGDTLGRVVAEIKVEMENTTPKPFTIRAVAVKNEDNWNIRVETDIMSFDYNDLREITKLIRMVVRRVKREIGQ